MYILCVVLLAGLLSTEFVSAVTSDKLIKAVIYGIAILAFVYALNNVPVIA